MKSANLRKILGKVIKILRQISENLKNLCKSGPRAATLCMGLPLLGLGRLFKSPTVR